jgi:Rho-binding antiterminator
MEHSGRLNAPYNVERLPESRADEVVSVLTDAFTGYPVMKYVLGPEGIQHHERLIRMFVMARVLRAEPLLGVHEASSLIAAGIVSFPGPEPAPAAFVELRERTWQVLGTDAERRYAAYGDATKAFAFPPGSVHLNMIGARRSAQRRGLGRSILDAVQAMSRARPGSPGVELTTETAANVAYYESRGFQLVGHARVSPTLESWGFFRPNAAPYAPIACSVHDELEAAATLGRLVTLTYEEPDGRREARTDRITDVGSRDGAEYVRLSSGVEVRLDRVVEVDGITVRTDRR